MPLLPPVPIAFQSHTVQTVFTLVLDRRVVASLLPPELELAPQGYTDPGHNPLLIIHAHYPDMTAVQQPSMPIAYDELVVMVPNTRLAPGFSCGGFVPDTVGFMPVLYLNEKAPVDVGVQYYGFNKHRVDVQHTERGMRVSLPNGTPLYEAAFGQEQFLLPWGMGNLQLAAGMVPTGFIGKRANADGTSTIIWSGMYPDVFQAVPSAVDGSFRSDAPLISGLDWLVGQERPQWSVNSAALGSYRARGFFQGTLPVECNRHPISTKRSLPLRPDRP